MRTILIAVAMCVACAPSAPALVDGGVVDVVACPEVVDAGPVLDARPHYWDECMLWCGARSLCDSFDLGSAHVCHAGCISDPATLELEPCGQCEPLPDGGTVP